MGLFSLLKRKQDGPQTIPDASIHADALATMAGESEERSLRDISVYADAVNSLVSLANVSTTAGQAINERTAISIISVFSAVRSIADDISKMEKAVFRKLPRGKTQVLDHPMHRLVCQSPNPEMGPMDFFRALMGSALLFGNGYGQIIRDKYTGEAVHIYPIHPWRVRALRDEKGMLFYSVDGCRRIEIGDMLHIKNFGTNGVLGIMTIRSAREGLGLTLALEQYGSSFFGNSALPKGIFYSDGILDDEAREALKKRWDKIHRGAERGHGTAVMEHGLKWQPMSVPNNEGQFLESRAFQLLECARLFRMPPHKLMDVSKGTMNNMEVQNGEYVQDCLMSWIVEIEEELKRKLTKPHEVDIIPKFLVRSFFRGDMAARKDFYASGIQWGYLNRNDAREMEDLNPVDGLDTFLVPQNYSAASALETMTKSQLTMLAIHAKANGVPLDENGLPILVGKDDGAGIVDDQADPVDQVIPEMNVPPPLGVVLPGTQPVDDSFFGRNMGKHIESANKPLLIGAFRHVLNAESDKVCRAVRKGDFQVDDFYAKHGEHVRSAIAPIINATAELLWAARKHQPTTEDRDGLAKHIDGIIVRHIAASKADLVESEGLIQRVQGWDARIELAASDELQQLISMLVPDSSSQHAPPAK